MAKRKNLPCSKCGEMMWRSRGSAPEGIATCRPCRRKSPTYGQYRKSTLPPVTIWSCQACGVQCTRKPTKGSRPKWCDDCRAKGYRKRIDCAECGQSCIAGRLGRYCSLVCANASRRTTPRTTTALVHIGPASPVCWLPAVHPVMRRHRKPLTRVFVGATCVWCEATFVVAGQTNARYCSKQCARGYDRAKRGRFSVPPSLRTMVYERDNWTCQLCMESVDRDLATTDPFHDWSPSLDHITPRSKGGADDASNLRLAHRWCNAVRGAEDYHADLFVAA